MSLYVVGQITVTSENDNYVVLPGDDLEITWIVSGIGTSQYQRRTWLLVSTSVILARIIGDGPLTRNNNTILAEGFDIRRPSTLILRNVDDRYNKRYKFRAQVNFKQYEAIVNVLVASKSLCFTFLEQFIHGKVLSVITI